MRFPFRRQTSDQDGIRTEGLERLLAFSDGVFAIAITLLILDIHLPAGEPQLNNAQLFRELVALWPKLFAYLLSFIVVAIFWVKHHTAFRYIKAYDPGLIRLNMVLLLVISFVPFPTAVLSVQSDGVALAFYALTMALGFGFSAWIWGHSTRRNLVPKDFDHGVGHAALVSSLVAGGVFLLAAAVGMVDARWGKFTLLLLIPVQYLRHWYGTGKRGAAGE